MRDYATMAASLYDGGWRAEDREQLVSEYNLTAEEVEEICKLLKEMEEEKMTTKYMELCKFQAFDPGCCGWCNFSKHHRSFSSRGS